MAVLQPGTYLIELESARPIEAGALARVMAALGFTRVVPDQMPEGSDEGAVTGALPGRSSAVSKFTAAPAATSVNRLAYASPTPAPPPTPRSAPAATSAVNQYAKAPPTTLRVAPRKPPSMINPATKTAERLPGYVQPTKKVVSKINPYVRAPEPPKKKEKGMFDWGPGGPPPPPSQEQPTPGGTEPGAESYPEGPGEPEAESYDYGNIPLGPGPSPGGEGGGGGGGGGEGYAYAPGDSYESSAVPMANLDNVILGMWQAWRQFGNPFAGVQTSGDNADGGGFRVRLLAELSRTLQTQDSPQIRWVSAVPVTINPFAGMSFVLQPYQLRTGRDYEIRFVSRARSAPTRAKLLQLLTSMGWQMRRLTAIKRHMRLPGRSGASLTLWYGIGKWTKPESLIVADDPFYFEDVHEIGTEKRFA